MSHKSRKCIKSIVDGNSRYYIFSQFWYVALSEMKLCQPNLSICNISTLPNAALLSHFIDSQLTHLLVLNSVCRQVKSELKLPVQGDESGAEFVLHGIILAGFVVFVVQFKIYFYFIL